MCVCVCACVRACVCGLQAGQPMFVLPTTLNCILDFHVWEAYPQTIERSTANLFDVFQVVLSGSKHNCHFRRFYHIPHHVEKEGGLVVLTNSKER